LPLRQRKYPLEYLETSVQSHDTGVLTGGEVTINTDNTKFDVAEGTGLVLDWTDPLVPQRIAVSWDALSGISVPIMAAGVTSIFVDATGTIGAEAGFTSSPSTVRSRIYLQSAVHSNIVFISEITSNRSLGYEHTATLLDYVSNLGTINKGNKIRANGSNLNIDRTAGTLYFPFLNGANSPTDPSSIITTAETIVPMLFDFRDGSGGFTFTAGNLTINPDLWDNGSGTLQNVSNNYYTHQSIFMFGNTLVPSIVVQYGQEQYSTFDNAKFAALSPDIEEDPRLSGAILTASIVVKKGASSLTDPAACFIINHR
jgi:hypothetical protein